MRPKYRWFLRLLYGCIGLVLVLVIAMWGQTRQPVVAESASVGLLQPGMERYEAGAFGEAIALWQTALTQTSTPQEKALIYRNLGRAYRQTGKLGAAIGSWNRAIAIYQADNHPDSQTALAALQTQVAQAYNDQGQHRQAISLLEQAIALTEKYRDLPTEVIARAALGKAYWGAGDYHRAEQAHLESLKVLTGVPRSGRNPDLGQLTASLPASAALATALNNLGNVYVSRAERSLFQAGVACAQREDSKAHQFLAAANQDGLKALQSFQESINKSQTDLNRVQAWLNYSRLSDRFPYTRKVSSSGEGYRQAAIALVQTLPDSRDKVYALINLAQSGISRDLESGRSAAITFSQSLSRQQALDQGQLAEQDLCASLGQTQPVRTLSSTSGQLSAAVSLLQQAIAIANRIGDGRAESFALGSLGHIYELKQQPETALELTRQAQLIAQQFSAGDSLYRWQWQMGRLLRQDNPERAIVYYRQAVKTLKSIRSDIVAANRDFQFDFRDEVEPVYRELIELLLDQPATEKADRGGGVDLASSQLKTETHSSRSPVLQEVLEVLESLKLAELQNFFGDECVEVAQAAVRESSSSQTRAAVIYSIILPDRTELIVRPPGAEQGSLRGYSVPVSRQQLQAELEQLRRALPDRSSFRYRRQARKIYDLLIRPLEADLAATEPDTLVFIHDGVLRQVPMAALYDGQKFLIEKYPLATTPGLQLTSRDPLRRENLKTLALGLTVERSPFAPLVSVGPEISTVQSILGGTRLLDQDFTTSNLENQIQRADYRIIHMATHGVFGVDADSTFLLTYEQELKIQELDDILRSRRDRTPLELLTLSACETATGDERSTLGIAGVAVRAGVKSALATLWSINDEATVALIEAFYQELRQPNVSRAVALQKAQISLIKDTRVGYSHPAIWSPFILIGNWL